MTRTSKQSLRFVAETLARHSLTPAGRGLFALAEEEMTEAGWPADVCPGLQFKSGSVQGLASMHLASKLLQTAQQHLS